MFCIITQEMDISGIFSNCCIINNDVSDI